MATADVILSRASLHASLLAPAALNLVALVTLGGSEPTLPSLVTIAGLRLPRYSSALSATTLLRAEPSTSGLRTQESTRRFYRKLPTGRPLSRRLGAKARRTDAETQVRDS
ncbi:hypothetical protein M430DRAFT_19565 [Amorphotheca resinae ATCC 22711]|uniref:Secreted protein n=1 Tax=Amorphotheca resinae ATCC 22711 TaxID=857342 RepID=A0A2T3AZK4_AMORE|nr:hypothetical protein M430DRAFT_19565 [Amorphotheca resinae ATCC 22711]PSS16585.1 hypothetical protein M430DRAFT_19565 [Amorphotheca resinae ATCC 22711]